MHTIILHNAWQSIDSPASGQAFLRRFHKPTGLGGEVEGGQVEGDEVEGVAGEQVWLVVDHLPNDATLNGEPLALDESSQRVNITVKLKGSNELLFQVASESELQGVRLEIESA